MRVTCRPRGLQFALVALLAAAGCSGDPQQPYPVNGVIVFEDGQPAKELAGYSVSFMPASGEVLPSSFGTVEEDGTFVLSCKKKGDGAVAGKHHVVLSPPAPEDEEGDRPRRRPALSKVSLDPATATQEVTVEPKSNDITLKVKRAASSTR
jgi:hypothetical protein